MRDSIRSITPRSIRGSGDWSDVAALASRVRHHGRRHRQSRLGPFAAVLDLREHGSASPFSGLFLTREPCFRSGARAPRSWPRSTGRGPGSPFLESCPAERRGARCGRPSRRSRSTSTCSHPQGRSLSADASSTPRRPRRAHGAAGRRGLCDQEGRHQLLHDARRHSSSSASSPPGARTLGIEVLVEVHSYYRRQIEIAHARDLGLRLRAAAAGAARICLRNGAIPQALDRIRPHNAITVLDTHDGIGIVDIGADPADPAGRAGPGAAPSQIDALVEHIHAASRGQSRLATGAAASNLDLYQVNCTFFDAMARDERRYLLARAFSSFCQAFRRSITSDCWPGRTTWRCSHAPGSAATSIATTTRARRSKRH